MASTNKTTNYNLSQYVGSDKPTYLGDYNSDMLKIDTAMKTNADNITSVGATATTASENASTALSNANTAQSTANTANTNAGTAQSTANSALAKATTNEASINEILAELNLNSVETINLNDITVTPAAASSAVGMVSGSFSVAKNSAGTLAKIYGRLNFNAGSWVGDSVFSFQTSLRPTQDITINALGDRKIVYETNPQRVFDIGVANITIKTTGVVEIPVGLSNYVVRGAITLYPCLLFIKDFGDSGSPD